MRHCGRRLKTRARDYIFFFRAAFRAHRELFCEALRQGIETKYVCTAIRRFRLMPEHPAPERWPWPVKLYCLGRFELLIGDEVPMFSRKTPRKALSLLSAIVALGGRDVPEDKLVDALWPDDEGDAGRNSLVSTLHRLRELLGVPEAIVHRGGRLSLDQAHCWVDALAFQDLVASCEPASIDAALALYNGAFLGDESEAPWAVPMRERLRARFVETMGKRALELEREGRVEAALSLYLRGLEADDLVEPFYQGLMRCYDRLERRSEAVSAYRRLTRILSIKLGAQPSPVTERLYRTVRPA